MKRIIRAVAVTAPFVGVVIWFAVNSQGVNAPGAAGTRPRIAEDADHGRTRDLPATGPVAAPGGPSEMMLPADRVREIMPHLDPRLFQQPRATQS